MGKKKVRQETEQLKREAEEQAEARDRAKERMDAQWKERWWNDFQRGQKKSQQKVEEESKWSKEWWEQWKHADENDYDDYSGNDTQEEEQRFHGHPAFDRECVPPPPIKESTTNDPDCAQVLAQLRAKRFKPIEHRKQAWRELCL